MSNNLTREESIEKFRLKFEETCEEAHGDVEFRLGLEKLSVEAVEQGITVYELLYDKLTKDAIQDNAVEWVRRHSHD